MNPSKSKPSSGMLTAVTVIAVILAVGACASGTILKWNQVDVAALMRSDAGKQKFNVVRFQTYGPVAEQIFGYFLYRDGIEVISGGGTPVVNVGKMTLAEVAADYNSVRKSLMYSSGSGLIVREILRRDSVVGYTAADVKIDVDIWDITPGGKESGAVLQLVYGDARGKRDGGTYRGRSLSGD